MALNKLTSLDKSRSSSRTETEDTVKPQNKKDQFYQPVQMIQIPKNNNQKKKIGNDKLRSDNLSVSSMSVHGASITTVSPDK